VCGREFKAARSNAVYDRPACRQTAKRDRDGLYRRKELVRSLLFEIGRAVDSDYKRVVLNQIRMTLENVQNGSQ